MSVEDWERRVAEELEGRPARSLARETPDGVRLEPLYTAADLPGRPATTIARRSTRATALCTIVDGRSPEAVATQLTEDLGGGAEGIWLRLDRMARLAVDPRDPGAEEPTLDGAPLLHGSDLARAFAGLSDEPAPDSPPRAFWLDCGANALPWAALWLADCDRTHRDPAAMETHFGADPLGALARDGALPRDLMKVSSEAAALARFTSRRLAGSTALTLSTAVYEEAGADMPQQLGLLVATLVDTLRGLAESGLSAAEAAPVISLRLAVGVSVFPEIAKLRAARVLWRAALGAAGVSAPPPAVVHVVGSRRVLTRRDPSLNLLRASEQAFAAICGGGDALSLPGLDVAGSGREGCGPLARRLARGTGLILEREGALGRVGDPAAGSYLVEALTWRLAEEAWALAQRIESEGGMRRLLQSGRVAEMVAGSAERRHRALERGDRGVAGVTRYLDETAPAVDESSGAESGTLRTLRERFEEHRASWPGSELRGGYSRDFVVEELIAAAARGDALWELGRRLGGPDGAETAAALPLRRDAAPFEKVPEAAARSGR